MNSRTGECYLRNGYRNARLKDRINLEKRRRDVKRTCGRFRSRDVVKNKGTEINKALNLRLTRDNAERGGAERARFATTHGAFLNPRKQRVTHRNAHASALIIFRWTALRSQQIFVSPRLLYTRRSSIRGMCPVCGAYT